jgi:tetratricopeptide (TPR) repeat protein
MGLFSILFKKHIPDSKSEYKSTATVTETTTQIDPLSEEYQKEVIKREVLSIIPHDAVGMHLLDIPYGIDLFTAEVNKDYAKISDILDRNPHILHQRDRHRGKTLLHYSSMNGAIAVTDNLLQRDADVNSIDNDGTTPLIITCGLSSKIVTARLLISKGAEVNYQTPVVTNSPKHGWTALHLAARNGHTKLVDLLISHGARVNTAKADGWTPLHVAVFFGHIEIVKLLLSKDANINARTNDGATPLMLSNQRNNEKIIKILEEAETKVSQAPSATVQQLVAQGEKAIVEGKVQDGAIAKTGDAYVDDCFYIEFEEFGESRAWFEMPEAKPIPQMGNSGRVEEALRLAQPLRDKHNDFDFAYYWLAALYGKQGRYGDARSSLMEGLRLAKSKYSLCSMMGDTEWELDGLPEAVKWWIRSVVIQISVGKIKLFTPFLYLASVAEQLGLGRTSSRLTQYADRTSSSEIRLDPDVVERLYADTRRQGTESMRRAIELLDREFLS